MKRKALAGIMSLALMAAVAVPVHAETENKTTTINTRVESKYELTIPANTTIDFNKPSTELNGKLKVTGNVKPSQTVTVSAATNKLENQDNAGASIDFALKQGASDFTSETWNETELRDGTKEFLLSVAIDQSAWDSAKAGDYTGGIVFTAELN